MLVYMSDWLEAVAEYIEKREKTPPPLIDLSEEIGLGVLEAEKLFERAQEVQSTIATLAEKMDHANT
jgi:hypothetical protein